jgi:hypothetical protein
MDKAYPGTWICECVGSHGVKRPCDALDGVRRASLLDVAGFPILDAVRVQTGLASQVLATKAEQSLGANLCFGADHLFGSTMQPGEPSQPKLMAARRSAFGGWVDEPTSGNMRAAA